MIRRVDATSNLGRYAGYFISYGGHRLTLFLVVAIPALLGFPADQLGVLELVVISTSLAAALAPLGTDQALKLQAWRNNRSNLTAAIVLSLALAPPIFLGLAALSGEGAERVWLVGVATAVAAAGSRVTRERLRVQPRLGPLVTADMLGLAWLLLSIWVLVDSTESTVVPVVAALGLAYAASFTSGLMALRRLPALPEQRALPAMVRFGLPLAFGVIAEWVIVAVDRFMLVRFDDLAVVGQYGVTSRVVMLVGGLFATFVIWFRNEAFRRGPAWIQANSGRALRALGSLSLGVGLVATLPAAALSARLVDGSTAQILPLAAVLMISVVLWFVATMLLVPPTVAGQTGFVGRIWGLAALVNVVMNMVLIPPFGAVGAAIATAASYLCAAVLARRSGVDTVGHE